MEKIIIIMLIITLGIFIYMYFTLRSQIKDITAQLDFIEKNRSNALITIRVKAGGSKALAAALNEMLENHRAERVMWKKKENEIFSAVDKKSLFTAVSFYEIQKIKIKNRNNKGAE